jgi:hypothetical protein
VTVKTYAQPEFLIFQSDTLKNNPKTITETCFQKTGNDSIKIEANSHIFKFKNNKLIMNFTEDATGRKFVQKFLYYEHKIDHQLLEELRSKKSDTVYFGCIKSYDKNSRPIKTVQSGLWQEIKNGKSTVNDNRIVEVYRYNADHSITTWRKEYFNQKYDIDHLKEAGIKEFTSKNNNLWIEDHQNYTYKKDEFGNWIEKRKINTDNPDVYYRKYEY